MSSIGSKLKYGQYQGVEIMYQNNPAIPVNTLSTMYDLPSEDWSEMGLPSAEGVSLEVSSGACPARQTLRVVGKPPTKWQVYEQVLQVPYYAVFDEFSSRFRMFCLRGGQYVESTISGQGFWLPEIELGLGIWSGSYQGVKNRWLRWYDRSGNWILTNEEEKLLARQEAMQANQLADQERQRANQEQLRADQEQLRAESAEQRAELLAAKLRELGIDVGEML
jgi:Putative restriction endonuclease